MATRLTLRTFKHKKCKVSISITFTDEIFNVEYETLNMSSVFGLVKLKLNDNLQQTLMNLFHGCVFHAKHRSVQYTLEPLCRVLIL